MESIAYLRELLQSIQACTKPIDDTDTSIDESWQEAYAALEKFADSPAAVKESANQGVALVIEKFADLMIDKYPDAELVIDRLVGDAAILFKTKAAAVNAVAIY